MKKDWKEKNFEEYHASLGKLNNEPIMEEQDSLLFQIEELQKQLVTLAEAVRELAKEVQDNRKFIETQAELSRKTVEALKNINDEVYQTGE